MTLIAFLRDMFMFIQGDGTFLDAASRVYGPKPLIGINTDPERFESHVVADGIISETMIVSPFHAYESYVGE